MRYALILAVSAFAQVPPLRSSAVVSETTPAGPGYLETYTDARFGLTTRKVTDSAETEIQSAVPVYSQLQAWNANQTRILSRNQQVMNATTFAPLHQVDLGWPAYGGGLRWSPTDTAVLYFTAALDAPDTDPFVGSCAAGNARLMKYTLNAAGTSGTRSLVACFTQYDRFHADPSYEEISDDGRYIALAGRRKTDQRTILFAYDLVRGEVAGDTLIAPLDGSNNPRTPDWVGMSPSGRYVCAMWANGDARFRGLEAYDRETMDYAGKVTTSSGHGDMTTDAAGQEWYVYTNANNAHFLTENHYIVESKIPVGTVYNGSSVDASATVSTGASVALLQIDWEHGVHVTCRNHRDPARGCVVSTYNGASGDGNGWQAYERELFFVHLTSTTSVPRVDRLAQHFSDVYFASQLPDEDCQVTSYFVQPHATLSPDGQMLYYGSGWGETCRPEGYILDLSPIR